MNVNLRIAPFYSLLLLLAGAIVYYFLEAGDSGYADFDFLSDDGVYVSFDSFQCESDMLSGMNITVNVVGVKENNYIACQDLFVAYDILWEGALYSTELHVGFNNCEEEVRSSSMKFVSISKDENLMCRGITGIRVTDYELRLPDNLSMASRVSDPLGQQPRIISSIPDDYEAISNVDLDDFFVNPKGVEDIQKRLYLITDYRGPIDGVWNDNMDALIRRMLDKNDYVLEKVVSQKTLTLLGVVL